MAVSNGVAVAAIIVAVAVGADSYVHIRDMGQTIVALSTKIDGADAIAGQAGAAAVQAATRVDQAGAFAAQAAARADQAGSIASQAVAKADLAGSVAAQAVVKADQAGTIVAQTAARANQAAEAAAEARDIADRLANRVRTRSTAAALPIVN